MRTTTLCLLLTMLPALAAEPPARNPVGVHTLFQDYMTQQVTETHLAWARHLVGEGGWIKPMIYPITPDLQGAHDSWRYMIRRAYEMGLHACLRMDEPLGYASSPGAKGDYAEIAAAYRRVAEGLLDANPTDRPIYFEIRNEPNNANEWSGDPNPVEYGRFYVAVARAIRGLGDPRARVGPGALSPGGSYDNLRFIDVLCTVEGFSTSIDAWMTHSYPGNTPPEINLHDGTADNRYAAIDGYLLELERLRLGGVDTDGLPVLITEMNFDLGGGGEHPSLTEELRVEYYVRAYRDYWMQWPEVLAVCPYYMVSLWAKSPEGNEWVWAGSRPAFDGRPCQAHEQYWAVSGMAKPGEPTGAVNGVVRDAFGNRVGGAIVQLAGRPVPSQSNGAGFYQFAGLAAGEYSLTVFCDGYETATAPARVEAGRNTGLDLVLPMRPPVAAARVRVTDEGTGQPLAGAVVELVDGSRRALVDEAGVAELAGLRPGGYDATVHGEGYAAAQVRFDAREDAPVEAAAALVANTLANGGLEPLGPEDRSVAPGWQSPDLAPHPWMHLDNTIKRGGLSSQRFDVDNANPYCFISHWTSYSAVTTGATYEVTAYVKTLGLVRGASEGAQIRLEFYSNDNQFKPVDVRKSEGLAGDTDWTQVAVRATAPPGADRLRTILIADAERGSAWFDDVVGTETLPPEPSLPELVAQLGDDWKERRLFGLNVVWGASGGQEGTVAEHHERLRELVREAGCTLTKLGISWGGVQRTHGGPLDWSTIDAYAESLKRAGVDIVCVYACVEDWAKGMKRPEDFEPFGGEGAALSTVVLPLTEFSDEYRAFSAKMAERYRGTIRYYEFWNEPDSLSGPILLRNRAGRGIDVRYNGDPMQYTYWLKQTYEGIKAGDPEAMVAVGGLVGFDTGFLEGIYAAGGQPYFDAVAIHPYDGNGINKQWVRDIREQMRRYGDFAKPIWITEYGWWVGAIDADIARGIFPAGLQDQADYLRDAIEFYRAEPYIAIASHHTLNDWRTNEHDPDSVMRMGLVTHDLEHKKPAFLEWQKLVQESLERCVPGEVVCELEADTPCFLGTEVPLRCRVEARAGDLPPGRLVLYELPDERVAATWEVPSPTAPRAFDYVFRPRAEQLPVFGNGFALEYRRVPGRAVARTERFVEVASPLAFHALPEAKIPYDLVPGSRPEIRVANHGLRAITFVPAGDVAKVQPVTEKAGESAVLPLNLRAAETPGVWPFTVSAVVDGETWTAYKGWYSTPADCPRGEQAPSEPQLVIAPAADDERWEPDSPFRAEVTSHWTDASLFLRIDVTEPDVRQTQAPRDMWREDSVQIAFDPLRNGGAAYRYDTTDDHEFGFALTQDGPAVWRWAAPLETSSVGDVPDAALTIDREGGKTVYRVELPWAELGVESPAAGRLIGLCIAVNDAGPGGRRYVEWPVRGAITAGKSPAQFGALRLVDAPR